MLSILPYIGSKREDIPKFKDFLPKNIKKIIEPFGGGSSLSLYLFNENNKIKIHVNDIDEKLFTYYTQMKEDYKKQIDKYNELLTSIKDDKEKFNKIIKEYKENKHPPELHGAYYLFRNKVHGIRMDLAPIATQKNKNIDINNYLVYQNFLKVADFTIKDYKDVFNEYKDDKTAFIFLDPPYFSSFNAFYINYEGTQKEEDNTKMYIDILDLLNCAKCKVLLIINSNAITNYIYSKYIKGTYNKIYQFTKKKAVHLIITNYKI